MTVTGMPLSRRVPLSLASTAFEAGIQSWNTYLTALDGFVDKGYANDNSISDVNVPIELLSFKDKAVAPKAFRPDRSLDLGLCPFEILDGLTNDLILSKVLGFRVR